MSDWEPLRAGKTDDQERLCEMDQQLSAVKVALRLLLEHYLRLANSGDAGFWNPEEEEVVIRDRHVLDEGKGA